MDPMHDFFRTIQRQIVYLDDPMAEKVHRYQGELLQFWNWAIQITSVESDEARIKVRQRLDYEIPAYLPRLRQDINDFLDPNYKSNSRADRRPVTPAG
jgi:hypothetical protein